jgi:hypothetical protein
MPPPQINGLGAYGRVFLQLYLIYLAIYKKIRIPGWYFILYALASIIGVHRVISLGKNDEYARLHGYRSVYDMPHYHEFIANFLINIIAGIYLLKR